MREAFTSQARNALIQAGRAARQCQHNYIGTEHILVGLLKEGHGTAGMVLKEFGVQ